MFVHTNIITRMLNHFDIQIENCTLILGHFELNPCHNKNKVLRNLPIQTY